MYTTWILNLKISVAMKCQKGSSWRLKSLQVKFCILLPGFCKGGTKPIDGALRLEMRKLFLVKFMTLPGTECNTASL